MFLCSLFFSFSFYESLGFNLNELPKADIIINTILDKTLMELRTKYPLSIIGVGGSQQDKKETTITVSFLLNQSLSKDECRKLIVDITEVLLKNINQNEDLQPYLYDVPFSYKNIKINVFLRHPDRSDINYPDISVFSLMKGIVGYDIDDPKIRYRYSTEEEPYEKALKIVQEQRSERIMTSTPESVSILVPDPQPPVPTFFQKLCQKFYDFFK
jgi:hypothetical protein